MGELPSGKVSENRTVMIVLAYLWILALIPFVVEKEDSEVQWHARNGLVLTAAEFIIYVALTILTAIPALGCLFVFLFPLVGLAALVVHVMAMVKGVQGGRLVIPVLSDYTSKF